jgi:hypothetical protein
MVNKDIDGFAMTNRRRTIRPITHEITKTKQNKIIKTSKKKLEERWGGVRP